jgi:hypothetical protein
VRIASRFNGPADSGHGGYTCGAVAALVGDGPARVSLRSPPPLERDLHVVRTADGVEVHDDGRLVAEAARAELELEVTNPVGAQRAAEASMAGYESWAGEHPFPRCFACGPERRPGDGMRLFPGSLGDGRFGAVWTPDPSLADEDGRVRDVFVWAALDCPTAAPVAEFGVTVAVLAQLHARINAPVAAQEPHPIVSWPLGVDGRKRHSACAIFDGDGRALAMSRALWIELRSEEV